MGKRKRGQPTREEPCYSSKEYWEERYKNNVSWEWYYSYDELKPLLDPILGAEDRVLEVGCGDKPLAFDMRKAGHTGAVCGIDFSDHVVQQLADKKGKGMSFQVMDARALSFKDDSFDIVIDKGTIDAMLCAQDEDDRAVMLGFQNARHICKEAGRVLGAAGYFVLVSHAGPETALGAKLLRECIMPGLLESQAVQEGQPPPAWYINVHCSQAEVGMNEEQDKGEQDEGSPAVYIISKKPGRLTRSCFSKQISESFPIKCHMH